MKSVPHTDKSITWTKKEVVTATGFTAAVFGIFWIIIKSTK